LAFGYGQCLHKLFQKRFGKDICKDAFLENQHSKQNLKEARKTCVAQCKKLALCAK